MHDHLDVTADLSSHPHTWWPTSVLTPVPLTDKQCQVPLYQPDSWQLTTCSSYSLTCILGWSPVAVIWPYYIYRLPYRHLGSYMTQLYDTTTWPYGPTCTTTTRSYQLSQGSLPCPNLNESRCRVFFFFVGDELDKGELAWECEQAGANFFLFWRHGWGE